jgi:hypothetical protein
VLVLFDHGTPKGLARALPEHTVHTAQSRGWDTLSNGALLNAAEEAGFELLLTTDRRIRYQQNLGRRRLALVVLTGTTKWSRVRQHADWIRHNSNKGRLCTAHMLARVVTVAKGATCSREAEWRVAPAAAIETVAPQHAQQTPPKHYSHRKATAGSTRIARRAGTAAARTETSASVTTTPTNTPASSTSTS